MAKALTDDEKQQILQLILDGKGCAEIAKQVGRSNDTISRIAATIGWRFGKSNLTRAHEARSAYSAERRALIAATMTERAEQLLAEMDGPHLVFNFGGKSNTYREHLLAQPTVEAKRQLIQAAREAMRTVLDIDRHDNRQDDGVAAVDEWLRGIVGDAVAA